jgi:hypothetical protein
VMKMINEHTNIVWKVLEVNKTQFCVHCRA